MAVVQRVPVREPAAHGGVTAVREGVLAQLGRLLQLEAELGVAETRGLLLSLAIAVGVAILAGVGAIASIVVLLLAVFAPIFGAPWEPFVIAGGGVFLLAVLALGGSAWRLRTLPWPRETLTSFEENWRWLAAQLRSRLTLR